MPKITLIGNDIKDLDLPGASCSITSETTDNYTVWLFSDAVCAEDFFHTLCATLRGRAYRVKFDS